MHINTCVHLYNFIAMYIILSQCNYHCRHYRRCVGFTYKLIPNFNAFPLQPAAKFVNESGALCPQLETPTQALDLLQEAVNAQGLTIGEDMYLAINAAGHDFFDHVSNALLKSIILFDFPFKRNTGEADIDNVLKYRDHVV